jgi:hypothetical protein
MWRSRLLYPTESKRAAEEILQRVVVESADFASAFLALLADLNPSPSERTEP